MIMLNPSQLCVRRLSVLVDQRGLSVGSSHGQRVTSRCGYGKESHNQFHSVLGKMVENAKDVNVIALSSGNSMIDETLNFPSPISAHSSS